MVVPVEWRHRARIWLVFGIFAGMAAMGCSRRAFAAAADEDMTAATDASAAGDSFKVFVADQETYDSNLYRLPESTVDLATLVSPRASREERINTPSIGVNANWVYGRQAVSVDLDAEDNLFSRNTALNNISGSGRLQWDWRVGEQLSGRVGADYDRSMANFAESRYLGKDLLDVMKYFASGRFQLGPRWAVYAGGADSTSRHSAVAARYNDTDVKTGKMGIESAMGADDTIALEYRYADARFPAGYLFNGAAFDRTYHETTTRLLIKYALSGKTFLDANAGYLRHDYPNAGFGAFSGDIWRVSLRWLPTEKTQFTFAGWRQLQAYLYSQSDYFLSKGGSVTPTWSPTEKITLSLSASWEDQNYSGFSTSAISLGYRRDKLNAQQATLVYTATQSLKFDVSYRYERRKSNISVFSYNDKLVNAAVKLEF